MTIESPPTPVDRPLARYAQLEVDHFCDDCGYNLHGQIVTRDERLGIFICRCPECGRFHPAGYGTTAVTPWLNRLSVLGLALWVVIVLWLIFMGVMLMAASESQILRMFNYTPNSYPYLRFWKEAALLSLCSAIGLGILLAITMWHAPQARKTMAVLLPVLATIFIWWVDRYNQSLGAREWILWLLFLCTMAHIGLIALGLLIGRPLARIVVRMFIPPKPRQVMAFLWKADGKTPPTV